MRELHHFPPCKNDGKASKRKDHIAALRLDWWEFTYVAVKLYQRHERRGGRRRTNGHEL